MLDKKDQEISRPQSQTEVNKLKESQTVLSKKIEEELKERQDPRLSEVKEFNSTNPNTHTSANPAASNALKARLNYSINHASYLKEKGKLGKPFTPIFTIEEQINQASYTNEDIFAERPTEVSQKFEKPSIPGLFPAPKKRAIRRPTLIKKKENADDSKDLFPIENSVHHDSQLDDNIFEQSNISSEFRAPHAVFKKKFAVPVLDLFPNNGSIAHPSPIKPDYMQNNLSEDELEVQQENKVRLSSQKLNIDDVYKRYATEQVSEIRYPEEASVTYNKIRPS